MPDKKDQKLFNETIVPAKVGSGKLFDVSYDANGGGAVECLGMTFANDTERRAYFLERLREKLLDPEFRKIEGFPIGSDEDILALSDPPYYTICPNPWIEDFVKTYGKLYDPNKPYSREPFASDVSEGKTDPIYNAHAYHTKVPYKAIIRYILHYTEPGDIVYDGFCGTGMTGVAAQACGDAEVLRELGYSISDDGTLVAGPHEAEATHALCAGARRSVVSDLSTTASFIASNYCLPVDSVAFGEAAREILKNVALEVGWMYETRHPTTKQKGRINFTVWSDIYSCPDCAGEIVFVDEAFDAKNEQMRDSFNCPHCNTLLKKGALELRYRQDIDPALGKPVRHPLRRPVLIDYSIGKTRYTKKPDATDLEVIDRIGQLPFPSEVPIVELPDSQMRRVGRMQPAAITHVHHFFHLRAAHSLASLWRHAFAVKDRRLRNAAIFFVEQAVWTMSVLNRFRPSGYSQVNQYLSGVFYVPSQHAEVSPEYVLDGKMKRLCSAFSRRPVSDQQTFVGVSDCSSVGLPPSSIDYVFTDPPFGENIYYADLNFLVESWYRVFTASSREAIIDRVRGKSLPDYQHMMQQCFDEYHRVLKPGRWVTVEFHNSKNSVWNSIQEALQLSGFVIADVRMLDKKQGSFQQVTSRGAVKQDLVISAYKPNGGLVERFEREAGTETGVWDFVRTHLGQLPVFVSKDRRAEVIAERQNYLLFDRMVAFHVRHGVPVPISAGDFYAGLAQRFAERDGMYFLPDQVVEYDRKRMTATEIKQLDLFVTDESSAIQWLRQQLTIKPQTFQELHPQFLREIGGWEKHEEALELSGLLEENFLRYDGREAVPGSIHSYLSTTFKELRNLPKDDPTLRQKGKDRWYVPDPNKAGDLEKLRERGLLREFDQYKERRKRFGRNERFRMEAVRAGFKKAWQDRDYETIIAVAELIPESILQEDPKLLMWYDQAVTRRGE
jgi:DNA modification methylase